MVCSAHCKATNKPTQQLFVGSDGPVLVLDSKEEEEEEEEEEYIRPPEQSGFECPGGLTETWV
jgi:hypothetical protein